MSQPADWHPRLLDEPAAAKALCTAFPEFASSKVRFLGQGCESEAYLVDGRYVFRFPKHPGAQDQHRMEDRLLSRLRPSLRLAVPEFSHQGQGGPGYPFAFVGYPLLPGTLAWKLDPAWLDQAALLDQALELLKTLHALPLEEARSIGMWEEEALPDPEEGALDRLRDAQLFESLLGREAWSRAKALLEAAPPARPGGTRVPCHRDLAPEHLLVDEATGRLSGVLDWGDASIAVPAADFTWAWMWLGGDFARRLVRAYGAGTDDSVLPWMRHRALVAGLGELRLASRQDMPASQAQGRRAVDMALEES